MRATYLFISVLTCIATLLFWFQPKNVEGPRVASVSVTTRAFPYEQLDQALKIAYPEDRRLLEGPDFEALRSSPVTLDHYLGIISRVGPRNAPHRFLRREERLAYFLNAYTAGFLAIIRDACPLTSVDDPYWFGGLFWRVSLLVGGEEMSLNDLASAALELSQGDVRVLLALSKGLHSDLPLRRSAWRPDDLEAGLSELQDTLVQEPYVKRDGDRLILSALFQWYEHRFSPSPLRYLQAIIPEVANEAKRVEYSPAERSLRGHCPL